MASEQSEISRCSRRSRRILSCLCSRLLFAGSSAIMLLIVPSLGLADSETEYFDARRRQNPVLSNPEEAAAVTPEDRTEEIVSKKVGWWNIGLFINAATRKYSHCAMTGVFQGKNTKDRLEMRSDRIVLVFKMLHGPTGEQDDNHSGIAIGGEWNLVSGNRYSVEFTFNGEPTWYTRWTGTANSEGNVLEWQGRAGKDELQLFKNIGGARNVEIQIEGESIGSYSLNSSKDAITMLMNCHMGGLQGMQEVKQMGEQDRSFGGGRRP